MRSGWDVGAMFDVAGTPRSDVVWMLHKSNPKAPPFGGADSS